MVGTLVHFTFSFVFLQIPKDHRDQKKLNILNGRPQNLLIDNDLHLKLADFGLARAFVVGRRAAEPGGFSPQCRSFATLLRCQSQSTPTRQRLKLNWMALILIDLGLKSHVVDICNICRYKINQDQQEDPYFCIVQTC